MVEVTRSNFNEIFPLVEKSIKNSAFIAIDVEFTGLSLGPSNENNLFDSIKERYEKLRCRATSFIPCQIGLSTFTKCLNENSYSVETYIFYIRPCMVGSTDRVFTCQASALDFLQGYNFDFQKFIYEGIPYLNENERERVRQELEDGSLCIPHEKLQDQRHQENVNNLINQNLLKKRKKGKYRREKELAEEKVYLPIDKKSHVYFQLCEIRRRFPKLWAYVENDKIALKMFTLEDGTTSIGYKARERESVLDYFTGFTKVFKLMKELQKPIVGHNLLMDLMLFYQNFHQNLPDSYDQFKKEIHNVFPVVYDTKYIWLNIKEIQEFKNFASNSSLTALYELLKDPPNYLKTLYSPSIIPTNCEKYRDEEYIHDSGYDAYMTGFVFLNVCHILASSKNSSSVSSKPLTFKQHLHAVSPFVNKVNFSYFRLSYMNLDGSDPPSRLPGYLYISPKTSNRTLTRQELNNYFCNHNALEFKFIKGQKAALAVAPSNYIVKRILRECEDDPDLIVEEYKFLKHSPYVSATLWLTAVVSGGLLVAWIWNSR